MKFSSKSNKHLIRVEQDIGSLGEKIGPEKDFTKRSAVTLTLKLHSMSLHTPYLQAVFWLSLSKIKY